MSCYFASGAGAFSAFGAASFSAFGAFSFLAFFSFFAGLSVEQAAELLGLSRTTAYEHWAYARVWLHAELYGRREPS